MVQIIVAISTILLATNAIGTLILAALGQPPSSSQGQASGLMDALMVLTTVAFATTQRQSHQNFVEESTEQSQRQSPDWSQRQAPIGRLIAHISAAVIVGIYYGGTLPPPAPQGIGAGIGAIGAGVMAGILSPMARPAVQVGLSSLRTVVIYGGAFLNGAVGCMVLSVGQGWGLGLVALMIWSLGVTARSARDTVRNLALPHRGIN
jgi:hypothetical protein